jgi:hypothetical protein
MDICFNFRTSYIDFKSGKEITEWKLIGKSYLLQWRFWCDIVSIIPFELIYKAINSDSDTNTATFRIFDLLKLIRLLRLGRLITYLKFKQDIKIGFRIVYLIGFLMIFLHWCACIWYIIIDGSNWKPS